MFISVINFKHNLVSYIIEGGAILKTLELLNIFLFIAKITGHIIPFPNMFKLLIY